MYTLKELFDNLEIPLAELKRRSGISDVTLISIRNGKSARRSTINKLLRTFSDIYGVKLTLKNVEGIIIQGKPVNSPATAAKMDEEPPVPSAPISETTQPESYQNRTVEQKRAYNRKKEYPLPDGCILASEFAATHRVARGTFYGHMDRGMEGEKVDYSSRPKLGREHEKERYLTSEQRKATLEFWKRYGVRFVQCDRPDCPCKSRESQTG